MFYKSVLCACIIIGVFACKPNPSSVSTKSATGELQAVIEIPAGTNLKYEWDTGAKKIAIDQENGKDRIIDFLPYPANYGFIPGTLLDENKGGDGDALDVFVLNASVPSGTVISIKPIAVLKIKDSGQLDSKIIAVPLNEADRVMKLDKFSDFVTEYHMVQQILQTWVLSYKGLGKTEFLGWEDEKAAEKLIEKWSE